MAKQTKPFIVEIKPSRKPKSDVKKTSIWGSLDLKPDAVLDTDARSVAPGSSMAAEVERS